MSEDAFLAALLKEPGDDATRLVYADWLEERGDTDGMARAEFLRTQVRLAGLAEEDARRALEGRLLDLLLAHGRSWLRPYYTLSGEKPILDIFENWDEDEVENWHESD
jgi:uncharacterized protein (TIGR02996 family)